MALLEVEDIHTFYGNIEALKGVSLEVNEGEIVTLIGSNGAGKSTTLRSISGLSTPRNGADHLRRASDITRPAAPADRAAGDLPVARGPALLPAHDGAREPRAGRLPAPRRARSTRTWSASSTLFPRLEERQRQKAGTMSGGEQQMLAIGRALMAEPKLLLLDEPSMGIAPILVERIYETIREINQQGTTILLVEQNANYALDVSDRGYVLETGTGRAHRRVAALRENPEVQAAYLGA